MMFVIKIKFENTMSILLKIITKRAGAATSETPRMLYIMARYLLERCEKMNVLVVLGHPSKESFNFAIAETVIDTLKKNGHNVIFHDLYRENFSPIVRSEELPKSAEIDEIVKMHCQDLINADGIIIVHPNWWGQPPAILKGWIDRVIRPGVAYEFEEGDKGEGVPIGLLKASKVLVINTSDTSEEREKKVFDDPLEQLWKNCIFDFCGVNNFYRKVFRIIVTSTLEKRKNWLREVSDKVSSLFPKSEN